MQIPVQRHETVQLSYRRELQRTLKYIGPRWLLAVVCIFPLYAAGAFYLLPHPEPLWVFLSYLANVTIGLILAVGSIVWTAKVKPAPWPINLPNLQMHHGSTEEALKHIGGPGELFYDIELFTVRIHDGVTPGGRAITRGPEPAYQEQAEGIATQRDDDYRGSSLR